MNSSSSPGPANAVPRIPDFHLLRIIGRGSYGDVWLARGVTGLWRAIKVVWRERFTDAGPFEREFKGLKEFAAISVGESIQMALLHVGRNDIDGFFYYVMELADDVERGRGIDPANYVPLTLTELRTRGGRLPAADCLRLGVETSRALASLHAHGLVHRDIKPSNVILVGGVAKLADIGLVALATDARTFVGTEGYVPPEGPGAPSADIFALGKVLYELSTGLDRQEFPQLPPEMNRLPDRRALLELNEIILRACDALPEKRYHDGGALLVDLEALQTGRSMRGRRVGRTLMQLAAVLIVAGAGIFLWGRGKPSSAVVSAVPSGAVAPSPVAVPEKSIAVLPFANMSPEKDSEFFADGICEDVLTNLTGIEALRVASRTSALQYRDTKKPLPQIARELGVAYILEGSVRRVGNKVRVTGQLIRAATDEHVWAKSYDRDLSDIFAVQTELAVAIADALQTALSPQEKENLERRPTENMAAYDLYLQGRAIVTNSMQFGALYTAETKLRQAVSLDPSFAEAWAELGDCHALLYFSDHDSSPERIAAATQAMDTAVRLAPDDPLVIARRGSYYLHGFRDYVRATEQFARLAQLRPNDPEVPRHLGDIQAHQGRWADAIASERSAMKLDPGNFNGGRRMIQILLYVRRYDEAESIARRFVRDFPAEEDFWSALALIEFNARGSTAAMNDFAHHAFEPQRADRVLFLRKSHARISGNFAEAIRLDHVMPFFSGGPTHWCQEMVAALTLANAGDLPAAQMRARSTLEEMIAEELRQPTNSWLQCWLGQAYALLGDREKALRHVERAIELVPESRDAEFGIQNAIMAATVRARLGDKEEALAEFARLFRTPGGEHVSSARFGVSQGPTEVSWRPIMDDPRYQALIADPKNNEPLL